MDPYFIKYDGTCENCDNNNCELCYYGTISGADVNYTLQQNFLYVTNPGSLVKKCFSCYYEQNSLATMVDGSCQQVLGLRTKSPNCAKWVQINSGSTDSDNFQCTECTNGYGFDASLAPNLRVCDQSSQYINVLKCQSYYYTLVNNLPSLITCQRCEPGFTAVPSLGCVNCSSGKQATLLDNFSIGSCKSCIIVTQTGFNFTQYLLQGTIALTQQKVISAEIDHQLNYKPFCTTCGSITNSVYDKCYEGCLSECFTYDSYNGCKIDDSLDYSEYKCESCGLVNQVLPYSGKKVWSLNKILSADSTKCLECHRYCLLCEEQSISDITKINPYVDISSKQLQKYMNKCIVCRDINEICADYTDTTNSNNLSGFKLSCTEEDKAKEIIFYDPSIKQCTPCSQANPNCKRTIKIQQIIECRQVTADQIAHGKTNQDYFKNVLNGSGNIQTLFETEVLFLQSVIPLQTIEIDFKPYEDDDMDMNQNLQSKYLALNDENVQVIEFEILFVPATKDYTLQNGTKETGANVCQFSNDINFKVKIAKYIVNIQKLSLTFKTINPENGSIGQSEINMFITSFSFNGWNDYLFQNIKFYSTKSINYSLKAKLMLFDFTKNLFQSKLTMKNVQFISGMTAEEQNKNIKNFKANITPVIEVSNLNQIIHENIIIDSFIYQSGISFFRLDEYLPYQISLLKLQINNFLVRSSQFEQTDFIVMNTDEYQLELSQITFDSTKFIQTNIIKQAEGYVYELSKHIIKISTIKFIDCVLNSATFVLAYNLFKFQLDDFTISGSAINHIGGTSALITTNVLTSNDFIIKSNQANDFIYLSGIIVLALPSDSNSKLNQEITLNRWAFTQVYFSLASDGILSLTTFITGNLAIETNFILNSLIITQCLSKSDTTYLFRLSNIDKVEIQNINVTDFFGGSIFLINQTSQVSIIKGSYKLTQIPKEWEGLLVDNKDNFEIQNGRFLTTSSLNTRLVLADFIMQKLVLVDRSLIEIQHISRNPNSPPEYLYDSFEETYINPAAALDNLESVTNILILNCTFDNINVNVANPAIATSLIYVLTSIKYRIILYNATVQNIVGYSEQTSNFKESSSFFVQDSKYSSLFVQNSKFKDISSVQMQNGLTIRTSSFFCFETTFENGNFDKKNSFYNFKGGFLNILASTVSIRGSSFKQSVADEGGAIYIKTFSSSSIIIYDTKFEEVCTTQYQSVNGVGGAISIDARDSELILQIELGYFKKTTAQNKGGFLAFINGIDKTEIYITNVHFQNNYATSGSLFNLQFQKSNQILVFSSNTITFDEALPDVIQQYGYHTLLPYEIQKQIKQFYLIIVEGGLFKFEDNIFDNNNFLQGVLYVTSGQIEDNRNTFSNSTFHYTPVIYYYNQKIISLNSLYLYNITQCIDCFQNKQPYQFLFYITAFNSFLLIENPLNLINVIDLSIELVFCSKCTQGIFGIAKNINSIKFIGAAIKENISNLGILYYGGSIPVERARVLQIEPDFALKGCIFSGNKAEYGGAIYTTYKSLQLENTIIKGNKASQQGGGIYFIGRGPKSDVLTLLDSTQIFYNTAQIGGGVKIISAFIEKKGGSVVKDNTAKQYGSDVTQYPIGLKMMVNGVEAKIDSVKQTIFISNWVSGITPNYKLEFYHIGVDGNIQYLDVGQTATLTISMNYDSQSEIPENAKVLGTSAVNYNTEIGGFILDKVIFSQQPLGFLKIKAKSSLIQLPQYDPEGSLVSFNNDYILPIILQMRSCIIGETYISSSSICLMCEKGTYSLIQDSVSCKECPKFGVNSCPGGKKIELSKGYWRPYTTSDQIEQCFNQESNCNGGMEAGDQSCQEGHIGALCEVCDISGKYWKDNYSHTSEFSCIKCNQIVGNWLKMIGLSIYTIFILLFSVKSTKALLDSHIMRYYFEKAGFIQKTAQLSKQSTGIIIKLFTTYIQLIMVIQSFKLKLPPGLSEVMVSLGDPVKQMSYSMDCSLQEISGDIPMTYFRLIWSQLMPFIYVTFYLSCHYLYCKFKKQKNNSAVAWIAFIYIYISTQPSIVKFNIQAVSCRQISGLNFIKSNVSEECYTQQHIIYILALIIPTFMFWICIIPLYFLLAMYKGRQKLRQIRMQYKFGFLYVEYKDNSYFWEIVKIFQKTLVTIFINIYDSYNIVKGILVIFVIFIYIKIQQKYQPYREKRFNEIDLTSNITVIVSIIIALFILENPFSYLIWLGYICLVLLNGSFILRLLKILISSFTQLLEHKFIGKIFSKIVAYPRIASFLGLPKIPKHRIKLLWGKVREYVKVSYSKKISTVREDQIDTERFLKENAQSQLLFKDNFKNKLYQQVSDHSNFQETSLNQEAKIKVKIFSLSIIIIKLNKNKETITSLLESIESPTHNIPPLYQHSSQAKFDVKVSLGKFDNFKLK